MVFLRNFAQFLGGCSSLREDQSSVSAPVVTLPSPASAADIDALSHFKFHILERDRAQAALVGQGG